MHLETLLYMMLQSGRTLPPPNAPRPDFALIADEAARARVPNQWFDVPAQTITVGIDDPEDGTDPSVYFGWDNEKPAREVSVHAFQAKGRPITNEEVQAEAAGASSAGINPRADNDAQYAQYLYSSNIDQVPASWSTGEEDGSASNGTASASNGSANGHGSRLPESYLQGKAVRTVYGLVPLVHALDWPVFASYDELARCASWMGGRVPTADEARSIYAYVEGQKKEASTKSRLAKKVPAVNGHLVNDGVEETPPSASSSPSHELFADLTGANVGLHHWHPVPVTAHGGALAGRAGMGGVWEWTSSALRRHDGFRPMALYPAYTADFFDGKHNIVLGGSWATHPRIAGRASFVNWYQHNYPYAWAGARLVRDLPS
ncbi:hypothetical protein CDD83_4877 [Cordyceps sp. RAO-2017]|nr:hypothetical protein CDD83_4877 [Cordyceps sp. RAO-2017]